MPPEKRRARFNDGGNLYLGTAPNGSQCWFWKYSFDGKEKRLAIGSYPTVRLKDARASRDEARKVLQTGVDPTQRRRLDKAAVRVNAVTTYGKVAREFHAVKIKGWSEAHSTKWLRITGKQSLSLDRRTSASGHHSQRFA
ncbi:integrase arm-type DNA-binding domain-containing protein [Variovorax sp. AFSI2.2]|uniref:integrase arm-type DNA-binding domain-containing protein n=1 Tax=Variovorax sp. AFSI2.2 TaxID=3384160 RepID=UPI003EBAD256